MKKIAQNFRILMAILLASFVSCSEPEVPEEAGSGDTKPFPFQTEPPTLPVSRTIADSKGRSFDAVIVAKTGNDLIVTRKSDNKHFRIPVTNLSASDRDFANSLEEAPIPEGIIVEGDPEISPTINGVPRYVAFRRQEILNLEKEIQRLKDVAQSTSNKITIRSSKSEIEKIYKEITELEMAIDQYMDRNP